MKLRSRIPFLKLTLTLVMLQCIGFAFVFFRENFLLDFAQSFVWFGLIMLGCLFYIQRDARWAGESGVLAKTSWFKTLKTAGLFLFFVVFLWQINYLSLYESQPLMFTADRIPLRYDVLAGDLLGFTVRLALQTWVLALALALVFNKLPRNGQFGFIRGQYQKTSNLAWYTGNMAGAGVSIAVLFSLGLLTLDVGKFIAKSAGADIMLVPQLELMIFLFSLYLFNIAMRFTKKLKEWGEHPHTSLMFIVLIQLAFFLFVYCMSRAMLHFLPENTVYALMEPFYFDFIDPSAFPRYWQLFITALSFFMVPLLGHYFYHACQGEILWRSLARLLIVPLVLCLALVYLIPSAQGMFFDLMPRLTMQGVELNDTTSRYVVTWVSYFSVFILMMLLLMLQRSQHLGQSLVDVMPEQVGRRMRRVKAYYSRTYGFLVVLLLMYLLAGVVVSLYFSSIFLMATMLGLALCFVAGFKQREA